MTKEKKMTILYIILMYTLILQPFLQSKITVFKYLDELLAFIAFIAIIVKIVLVKGKIKISKLNIAICVSLISIFIIGVLANLIYGYQTLKYVFFDVIVFYKFYIIYFFFELFYKNKINQNKNQNIIYNNAKLITIILFILTILNYIFDIFPGEERYGIKSNSLFFGHPTGLAATCVFVMANILIYGKEQKRKMIYFLTLIIMLMSTMRFKAIAFATIAILLYIYIIKFNKKLQIYKIFLVGIICLLVSFNQFSFYFLEGKETARGALLDTSFKIANEYFPIGTGFGTFGSYFSGENYSPLYEKYNINNVWGLGEDSPGFVSDSFWPMILGQFGYLGALLYIICIILMYSKIEKDYMINGKEKYTGKILVLLYLLISSTAESAFVNPLAIPLAIILAL